MRLLLIGFLTIAALSTCTSAQTPHVAGTVGLRASTGAGFDGPIVQVGGQFAYGNRLVGIARVDRALRYDKFIGEGSNTTASFELRVYPKQEARGAFVGGGIEQRWATIAGTPKSGTHLIASAGYNHRNRVIVSGVYRSPDSTTYRLQEAGARIEGYQGTGSKLLFLIRASATKLWFRGGSGAVAELSGGIGIRL